MRRHIGFLSGVLGFAFALWAGDGHAENYLVLPILGDRISIVTPEPQKGSPDSVRTEVVPRSDPTLDNHVLRAVQWSIQQTRADATITMLRAADPKLLALRDQWIDSDAVNVRDVWLLLSRQPAASTATHLLLVVPYRAEPRMNVPGGDIRGSGKVAGLGFYVDSETRVRRSDTNDGINGFLGAFANFQLILIDLPSETVVARERVNTGETLTNAFRGADKSPLDMVSPARRDAALAFLVTEEIHRVLPGMLKGH